MMQRAAVLLLVILACIAGFSGPATADNSFRVLDISERTYEGGPSIAVLLSAPLDLTVRHDEHLRVSDPKKVLPSVWILSDDGRTLYFTNVQPETQYTVTVLDTLASAEGQAIAKRTSKAVTTRKVAPGVSFAGDGLLLPPSLIKGLPVATVNVPSIDVEFFRMDDDALVRQISWHRTTGRMSQYRLDDMLEDLPVVYSGRFDLNPKANCRTVRNISLSSIKALRQPGVYLAVMRKPGQYTYSYDYTYFVVTDIGLQARVYENMVYVLASSLQDGTPLEGVALSFLDRVNRETKQIAIGKTNEEGVFWGSGPLRDKTEFIKAEYNGQVGILPMDLPALDLSAYEYGKRKQSSQEVFAYGPRDLYRPGEQVLVSCLLRDYDGRPVPKVPVHAKLMSPDGREAGEYTWHAVNLSDDVAHYCQGKMNLSRNAMTGEWSLELRTVKGSKRPDSTYTFHVEEFLPERMKMDLDSTQETLSPTDTFAVDVNGMYLYGAPAGGNRLSPSVLVKAKRKLFDQYEDFQFGLEEDRDYSDFTELSDQILDDKGAGRILAESLWTQMKSPMQVRVTASLYESGGRPVTRSISRTMWPGKALVGIRPMYQGDSADEGPVSFEVIRLTPDGEVAPAPNLLVNITKEDRDYYWEYNEGEGWSHRYTDKNYLYLTDSIGVSGGKPSKLTTDLKNGRYLLSVQDPETGLSTSLRFYVGWWYWQEEQDKTARPDKVNLALDKPAYLPGDVIRLTVTPPHAGQAVIIVEGKKVLWSSRVQVPQEGTVVEIPVSANWDSHNLYISATVFRPIDAQEKIAPNRALGLIHLPLDRSQRKLELSIEAPAKTRPSHPVDIKVTLDKPSAKPVFVTLAAVDVGILNITNFQTPDPQEHFFGQRLYDVDIHDIYAKVAEGLEGELIRPRWGGDSDGSAGGKRPETKVKLVSLFQAPVAFDAQGQATITLDLPDFNGTLRLMAIAFGGDSYGSADKEMTVAAPIVTQLSMPRFLAPGDESQFTLDVHNLSGDSQDLSLKMKAAKPVKLSDGKKQFQLADKEKATFTFPVKATRDWGASQVTLELTGFEKPLQREWQLGVRPGYPGVSRNTRAVLQNNKEYTIDKGLLKGLIPSTMECSVKISPFLVLPVADSLQGLIRYPYGCLEQTMSSSYPLLVATDDAITEYGLKPISPEERNKRLESAMTRLMGMQVGSGGFGAWSADSNESAWLTVHAANFMLEARDSGYAVPQAMLDKCLKRVDRYLRSSPPLPHWGSHDFTEKLRFSIQAYAGYVMAKTGRASLGSLRTLFDNHAKKAASCLPLAHLGIALEKMGDHKRAAKAFEMASKTFRGERSWWGDYGSNIRDITMTLAILPDEELGSDKWGELLVELQDSLATRQYLSTQEKYGILLAGLRLDSRKGPVWTGALNRGGQPSQLESQGAIVIRPTLDEYKKGVSFTSGSQSLLFLSATVTGYTKEPPVYDNSGAFLTRTMYNLQGKEVTKSTFKVGEVMLVEIGIKANENVPDALIVDMLPAGFELENPALSQGVKVEDIQIGGESVNDRSWDNSVEYEEFLDDRYVAAVSLSKYWHTRLYYLVRAVTPGRFTNPPVMMESMYKPEIRAVGATKDDIIIENVSPPKQAAK